MPSTSVELAKFAGSLRSAFPTLVLLNGEMVALAYLVAEAPTGNTDTDMKVSILRERATSGTDRCSSPTQLSPQVPKLTVECYGAGPTGLPSSSQALPPFDVQRFICHETTRLSGKRGLPHASLQLFH